MFDLIPPNVPKVSFESIRFDGIEVSKSTSRLRPDTRYFCFRYGGVSVVCRDKFLSQKAYGILQRSVEANPSLLAKVIFLHTELHYRNVKKTPPCAKIKPPSILVFRPRLPTNTQ